MSLINEIQNRFQFEFIGRVIGILSGAILTIGLTRVLTPNDYGLLFLSLSIFGVAKLFSILGIPKSGARYITRYREESPDQIRNIIRFTFIFNIITALIVSTILAFGHNFVAKLLNEPAIGRLILLGSVFVFSGTFLKFARFTLQAFEDIAPASITYSLDRGMRVIFALGMAVLGYGALGALAGYIAASVIAALSGTAYVYFRHYRHGKRAKIEEGLRRRIAKYTIPLTATSAANTIDKRIDTVLVGLLIDPVAVAYYTLARQIVRFIQAPISALGFSLSPTFESQKAKGNSEAAARLYEETLVYVLLFYLPASAGIALIAGPFVALIFGAEYTGAVPVIQAISPYILLLSIAILTSNSLDYLGRARERAVAKGVTSILNLILNILLLPRIGVAGAAISTVLTFALYSFFTVYIMSLEFELRVQWLLKKTFAVVVSTGLMCVFVYSVRGSIEGFLSLFSVVGLAVVIWGVISILTGVISIARIRQAAGLS